MDILYISGGTFPDYQCDMLFHGLRTLFGERVVDAGRIGPMYRADAPEGSAAKAALYGRGFTLYGLLGGDGGVDRDDIGRKIAGRFYDLVIYGSVRRCQDHLHDVLDHYPSDRIAFVDGEDDQLVAAPILGRGLYFKREMNAEGRGLAPIQFAVPAEKIGTVSADKARLRAHIDPRDRTTYVYQSEDAYYRDYAESLFGTTMRKAGWDCLRHYEIMANGAIPDFEDLDACPPWTMVFLPKFELLEARGALLGRGAAFFESADGRALWERLQRRIDRILRERLTTEALARYVLDSVRGQGRGPVLM